MANKIVLSRTVSGAADSADTVKLRDETGVFGIKNNYTGSIIVAPTGAISPTSPGTYEYDVSALDAGNYTAVWESTETIDGETRVDYTIQVFDIDEVAAVYFGVTLADIERTLAPRCGPYARIRATENSADHLSFVSRQVRSSLDIGDYEDMYVLRRGVLQDGTAVPGFTAEDRIRICARYEPMDGKITVDDPYDTDVINNEMVEFHHLHPENQLREAVRLGLQRCFFYERVSLSTVEVSLQHDITSILPYITSPDQIRNVQYSIPGTTYNIPTNVRWWQPMQEGPNVILNVAAYVPQTGLVLYVRRPHFSFVNGATSVVGPNDDSDVLACPLLLAAAAGHVEAWRNAMPRMMNPARAGMAITPQQAANEFTKLSRPRKRRPQQLVVGDPMGRDYDVVANLGY